MNWEEKKVFQTDRVSYHSWLSLTTKIWDSKTRQKSEQPNIGSLSTKAQVIGSTVEVGMLLGCSATALEESAFVVNKSVVVGKLRLAQIRSAMCNAGQCHR